MPDTTPNSTNPEYKGFDAPSYKLCVISALRRLIPQRHCPRWGKEVRTTIRQLAGDLREMQKLAL